MNALVDEAGESYFEMSNGKDHDEAKNDIQAKYDIDAKTYIDAKNIIEYCQKKTKLMQK